MIENTMSKKLGNLLAINTENYLNQKRGFRRRICAREIGFTHNMRVVDRLPIGKGICTIKHCSVPSSEFSSAIGRDHICILIKVEC